MVVNEAHGSGCTFIFKIVFDKRASGQCFVSVVVSGMVSQINQCFRKELNVPKVLCFPLQVSVSVPK